MSKVDDQDLQRMHTWEDDDLNEPALEFGYVSAVCRPAPSHHEPPGWVTWNSGLSP